MFACSFILKFTYSKEHSFFHTILEVLTHTTTMLRLQNVPITGGKWGGHYPVFVMSYDYVILLKVVPSPLPSCYRNIL